MASITTRVGSSVVTLGVGDTGSPDSFVTVGQITTELTGPNISRSSIDTTSFDDADRVFLPGLRDGGTVSFTVNFDPNLAAHGATADGLVNLLQDSVNRTFQITLPSTPATTITFEGHVSELSPSSPLDGIITASVSIKVSGALTWA